MVGIKILCRVQNNNRLYRIQHIPTQIHTIINSSKFRDTLTKWNNISKPLDTYVAVQDIIYGLQKGIEGKFEILVVPWYSWRRIVRSDHQLYINVKTFDSLNHKDLCLKIMNQYIRKLDLVPASRIIGITESFKSCFEFTFENHAV